MILIPLLLLTVNLTYLGVFTGILAVDYPQLLGWVITAYVGAGICGLWAIIEIIIKLSGIGKRRRRVGTVKPAGLRTAPPPRPHKRVKEKAGKRAGGVNVCRK